MTNSLTLISEPPAAGTEIDTLAGSLDRIRRTFAWKCADLDAAAMGRRLGVSTGHADLIREEIDGRVGEDAPAD